MRSFIRKYSDDLLSLLRGLKRPAARPGPRSAPAPGARGFSCDRRGVVVVFVALAMPVLVGTMGLATEASYWYVHKRGMQNAADAAAIAAGTNGGSNYAAEAKAVAAQYGFTDGSGNITVTATNPGTASGCTANCYLVTISDKVPLFLSRVIGYAGTTTVGNNGMTAMAATSVAASKGAYPYCILALNGGVTQDIVSNGAPNTDLHGCNVMSNSSATCHGHNLNANIGDAHGTDNGCGIIQHSNVPVVPDPYSALASNIPADTCGGYPGENWIGPISLSGNRRVCGDLKLTGDTTISAPGNAVLVIYNGQLDLNGHTLQTASGSGLTIVFTGTNSLSSHHYPSGNGTLDIAASTSGPWSGIAIYQDPNLTTNVDFTYHGNSPTWNISGMVYLPHSSVTFSGAVGKSSQGTRCFGMTVGDITINGTGDIFANDTQCSAAGLALPMGGHRGTLVN